MRDKYVYELCENKTSKQIQDILAEVVLEFFKVNPKKAEKFWYGKDGIFNRYGEVKNRQDIELTNILK